VDVAQIGLEKIGVSARLEHLDKGLVTQLIEGIGAGAQGKVVFVLVDEGVEKVLMFLILIERDPTSVDVVFLAKLLVRLEGVDHGLARIFHGAHLSFAFWVAL